MKTLISALAVAASLSAAPALAQQQTPPPAQAPAVQGQPGARGGWMQGPQTRDQAKQRADMMFQRLDLNHDGTVTRDEVDKVLAMMSSGDDSGRADRMERMIDRLFGNAKSVTQAQFEAQALARFDAMDLNHDGVVTAAERQQAMAAMRGQAAGK
jgi:Spy/CpxP family protein refolding chaperone